MCLRLLRILDYDSDHKVEGRSILSNNSSMKILYITDDVRWRVLKVITI